MFMRPNRVQVFIARDETSTKCSCNYCDTVSNIELFGESCNSLVSALVKEASLSKHFQWKSFWLDYQDYFLELLSEGRSQLVRGLLLNLTYPAPVARDLINRY